MFFFDKNSDKMKTFFFGRVSLLNYNGLIVVEENMNRNDVLRNFAQRAKRRLVGRDKIFCAKIKVINNDDEDFRSKVEFLLSQEDIVTNPVHFLMDDKILKNMDEEGKERYLLSTLDKYNRLRNQIENEPQRDNYFCL